MCVPGGETAARTLFTLSGMLRDEKRKLLGALPFLRDESLFGETQSWLSILR